MHFPVNVLQITVNRIRAERQFIGNFLVGISLGEHEQEIFFAGRKMLHLPP